MEAPEYFSLLTFASELAVGLEHLPLVAEKSSISFGTKGFSIVTSDGMEWLRFYYKQVQNIELNQDELKITYPPQAMKIIFKDQPAKAKLLFELLTKFKNSPKLTESSIPTALAEEIIKRFQ